MTFFDVIIENDIDNKNILYKTSYSIENIENINKIDLRDKMPPIDNFELLGSTANSIATLIEYDIPNYRCSRMYIYYNERINTKSYNINNSIKSIIENGFCKYEDYPYNINLINERPSKEIYKKAEEYKYNFNIIKIKKDLNTLLLALVNNEPFIVSINVYESFETIIKNNEIRIKIPKEKEKHIGGITIVVCGYDINKQIFIIRYLNRYLELPFIYLLKKDYSSECYIFILRQFINLNKNNENNKIIDYNNNEINEEKEIIDLRDNFNEVYDQGKISSCSANSLCSIFEYDNKKFRGSRLFLYYNERLLINETHKDEGAYIEDGIKVLKTYGICNEKYWEYKIENVFKEPDKEAYENARNNFIIEAFTIENKIEIIKYWLIRNEPISLGIAIYSNFMTLEASKTGIIGIPNETDKYMGGHAVIICGYNEKEKRFILRNSWGDYWGDKGYFYLPYDYIVKYKLCGELWIITKSKFENN